MSRPEVMIHLPLPYYNSDQLIRTMTVLARRNPESGIHVPDPRLYQ